MALSGGFRYNPTTSRSFSIKKGSVDNHLSHPLVIDRTRLTRVQVVIQPADSPFQKASAPLADRRVGVNVVARTAAEGYIVEGQVFCVVR
jgi:hypothetical protein